MSQSIIKIGSTDKETIKKIQKIVGVKADGIFGKGTEAAVKEWQSKNNLIVDGIVGPATLSMMELIDNDSDLMKSKLSEGDYNEKHQPFEILENHLKAGEFVKTIKPVKNDYLFLHSTAGWDNPFNVIHGWNTDKLGAVGTEFVVGGQNPVTGSTKHNGVILRAMPEGNRLFHLGAVGSEHMRLNSCGIELCNFTYIKDGYTWTKTKVDPKYIVDLGYSFRGHRTYQRFTDEQIEAARKLILIVAERDNIDVRMGLQDRIKKLGVKEAFEYDGNIQKGRVKGLLTHTNVRKDKFDCHPQQELVDMIMSL